MITSIVTSPAGDGLRDALDPILRGEEGHPPLDGGRLAAHDGLMTRVARVAVAVSLSLALVCAATATAMYREMDMRFWLEQAEARSPQIGA